MVTFQAWSYTTPPFPNLQLVDVIPPTPEQLKPTEVLVEVVAAALNPVDVQLMNLSIFKLPALAYPKCIGQDYAGRIISTGSATELAVGDEVFGLSMVALGKPIQGTLSQVLIVDTVASPAILKKPASLSWSQAAALPLVWLTAVTALSPPYTYLLTSSERPTIVVLGGSSGVGIFAVQYAARTLNARVIATCSGKNAEFVKSLGAEEVIDYTTESILERLKALQPLDGYTQLVDCVGGTELLDHPDYPSLFTPRSSQSLVEGGGYVTIVGDKTDRSTLGGATTNLWSISQAMRRFWGWWGSSPRYACINLRAEKGLLEKVLPLVEAGLEIPIDSECAFDDVVKAYEKLNGGRARGKITISIGK